MTHYQTKLRMKPSPTHRRALDQRVGVPVWLRYSVIAAATLIMCSCRATVPGGNAVVVRGQSPGEEHITAPPLPTHLTPAQIQQAQCLPEGCSVGHSGCSCCNHGPIRGPDDEYLCDGGDEGLPAGVRADWRVTGLEQEDTVAHYDTLDGRTVVTPSNKVCIYAPRFGVVRRIVNPIGYDQSVMVGAVDENAVLAGINEREQPLADVALLEPATDRVRQPSSLLRERQQAGALGRDRRPGVAIGSRAPYANLTVIATGEVVGRDIVEIARSSLAAISWAGDQAVQVAIDSDQAQAGVSVQSPGTIYHLREPNSPKLRLIKLASTDAAKPGEEVEFTLRYDNVGDRTIGNVTIVDNLTTRLEYVAESQDSTAKSDFSTEANEAGSLLLRWEIAEPLEPGQGGVLTFKTRVR